MIPSNTLAVREEVTDAVAPCVDELTPLREATEVFVPCEPDKLPELPKRTNDGLSVGIATPLMIAI